ncbi:hypothetical protein ACIHFE_30970 [Streptomyces sp. NPDC052396]|uniref:hypothetical protein n=1 Tax=Streptomyces sp. NPDC052396 TaxID=3365689 RepID=UPI0037CD309E
MAVAVAVVVSVLTALAVTLCAALPGERGRGAPDRAEGPRPRPRPTAHTGDNGRKSGKDDGARVPSPGNSTETPVDSPGTGTDGGGSAGPDRTPGRDGGDQGSEAVPFTVATRTQAWNSPCGHNFLVDKGATQVQAPPFDQNMPGWVAAQGAVEGDESQIELTLQGRSREAVVLRAMHVRKVGGDRPPLPWTVYSTGGGCGGAIVPASFAVNLDAERPLAKAVPGEREDKPTPVIDFPISVSATDPQVLQVNARTTGCYCSYYLELEWSSGDRHGTVRVSDHGRPFRTSATKGRRDYLYGGPDHTWVRSSGQDLAASPSQAVDRPQASAHGGTERHLAGVSTPDRAAQGQVSPDKAGSRRRDGNRGDAPGRSAARRPGR